MTPNVTVAAPDGSEWRHEADQERQAQPLEEEDEDPLAPLACPRPLALLGAEEPDPLARGHDAASGRSVHLGVRQELHPALVIGDGRRL